jgi:hypothetical protein
MAKNDLTNEFMAGWNCSNAQIDNPYLWSSDSWLAFNAGAEFYKRGTSTPIKVRKSRGYSIRVYTGDSEFTIKYDTATLSRYTIERA